MGTAKITPAIEAAILKDYAEGLGGTTIAKRYGICKKMVQIIRERNGVAPRPLGVRGRKYTVRHEAFAEDTPEVRYWVGAMITDGCVHQSKKGTGSAKVILQVQTQDGSWVEDFKTFLGYSGPIYWVYITDKDGVRRGPYPRLAVASAQMAEDLRTWGVVPRKTRIARVIEKLQDDPDFWRGVIDGDGHINSTEKGDLALCSLCGWKGLVDDYVAMVKRRTGENLPIYEGRDDKGGRWWSASAHAKRAYDLIKWMYDRPGPRLARKEVTAQDLLRKLRGHSWRATRFRQQ
jgi:hypothetical protein